MEIGIGVAMLPLITILKRFPSDIYPVVCGQGQTAWLKIVETD